MTDPGAPLLGGADGSVRSSDAIALNPKPVWDAQGYAWEITTVEGGWGMDGVLKARQHVLNGIANGIDMQEWDPETDEFTAAKYSLADPSGPRFYKLFLSTLSTTTLNPNP